jgi:acyl-CoA reductase-like NAD-dependent aldehyde dehydrogenase
LPNAGGFQVVTELTRRSEEIARIITMESGKAIKDARQEVDRSIDTFELAAEEVSRIYGEHMPLDISKRTTGLQVSTIKVTLSAGEAGIA